MKIRPLVDEDRLKLHSMLVGVRLFTAEEIDVAMELIDIALKNREQKDYTIHCAVDDRDQPVGYICYGPTPMTEGTFDLYWIVVDPSCQGQKVGSKLVDFMEERLRELKGRMILADTSSIPEYDKTQRFYLSKGFEAVARVPDYYSPGNDRITYCKRLGRE